MKTTSTKRRASRFPTVARRSWDQNSWLDSPVAYRLYPAEGAPRDPSSAAPCRANRLDPCALSSGSSACDRPGKIPSRWPCRLLPAIPLALAAAAWQRQHRATELQRAESRPRAWQFADRNSWRDTEPGYQFYPEEGALRDPTSTVLRHAIRRGLCALSLRWSACGNPGKSQSQSLSRLLPAILPPASVARAKREPPFPGRYLGGAFHSARDFSTVLLGQNPECTISTPPNVPGDYEKSAADSTTRHGS